MWNCEETDPNGTRLADEMEQEDMYILNSDTLSRVGEGKNTRNSNLDLMFGSISMVNKITYRQIKDLWGSDHYPVEFCLQLKLEIYIKKNNRCSTKRTNWKEYAGLIRVKSEELDSDDYKKSSIEDKYIIIKDLMIESVNEATGRNGLKKYTSKASQNSADQQIRLSNDNRNRKRQNKEWWGYEYQEAINKRKECLNKWRQTGTMSDYIKYKEARAQTIKVLSKNKE